jgi:hypothetical protein
VGGARADREKRCVVDRAFTSASGTSIAEANEKRVRAPANR